ncbi:hypothetical protein DER63_14195 [Salmonella enterica]|nr:hypothetical protein [Salmonella enterica]
MSYQFATSVVYNRGTPPVAFLDELVMWAKFADDDVFTPNDNIDIYAKYSPVLGPWTTLSQRKAGMMEMLRVLAGYESSWSWQAGADPDNPDHSPEAAETGIFQVSANSMAFGDLEKRVFLRFGSSDPDVFIREMKTDTFFALDYAARLLRLTINANGPVLHDDLASGDKKYLHHWLSPSAMNEFMALI